MHVSDRFYVVFPPIPPTAVVDLYIYNNPQTSHTVICTRCRQRNKDAKSVIKNIQDILVNQSINRLAMGSTPLHLSQG